MVALKTNNQSKTTTYDSVIVVAHTNVATSIDAQSGS